MIAPIPSSGALARFMAILQAGDICPHCGEPIAATDRVKRTNGGALIFHRECLLRTIVGSVGHQLGRCPCKGGVEDDPPGMTLREAAIAAVELFERTTMRGGA